MNCNIKKCKAECCGAVPVQNILIDKFKHLINPNCETVSVNEHNSLIFDNNMRCGFLGNDNLCKIYIARPDVCRMFGDGKQEHPMLKCHYLGQCNEKEQGKMVDDLIEKLGE